MIYKTSGDEDDDGFPPTDVMPFECDMFDPLDPLAAAKRGITAHELDMDEESFWRLFR